MAEAARVLIDGPSELVFSYGIPSGWAVKPGCRVRIPLRKGDSTGTVLSIESADDLKFKLRPIKELIDPKPLLTSGLLKLATWTSNYYGCPLEQVMRALLPEAVRQDQHSAKEQAVIAIATPPSAEELAAIERKAPRQYAILSLLGSSPDPLPLKELGGSGIRSSLKALIAAGHVVSQQQAVQRDPDKFETFVASQPLQPNPEQQAALETINDSIHRQETKPILLHGVTGSGKTEVYLQAAAHTLEEGRDVLILVPEIALTPQTVQRFKSRFADTKYGVAVLHSKLSQGERFDEWHRIRNGEARIVIGARSGIFAPLPKLGLIIVDEEHEHTYKQDQAPKYNGRDLSIVRSQIEKCTIVLGSATPSLESWHNVQTDRYHLINLKKRADHQSLPLIRVLDMRQESRKKFKEATFLSERLREGIQKRLDAKEQVILFLNRRGFARSLTCPTCGHVCECTHCSVPLTYHRKEERLICHICGHQRITPQQCPECHLKGIHLQGYGTEKVEEVLQKIFPKARIARLDADTARRKNAVRDTLKNYQSRKIDILLGTQMIAKGLDFPSVTLVGVLNADLSLHAPDFRAAERTFQLMTQVAGRAGRGDLDGEVIVQTFTPHAPSIQFARHHDFEGYAEQELEFRREFRYPPYTHAAVITSRSTHERRAEFTLQNVHQRLKADLPEAILLGEPLPSPLTKAHGQYRFQIMLRSHNARLLSSYMQEVLKRTPPPDDVHVILDMDALDFS